MFQGRRFKTSQYKKWREDFGLLARRLGTYSGNLKLEIHFYIKHDKTTDLDNLLKGTLDALQENRIIKDDRFIRVIHAYKHKSKKERIELKIEKYDKD